MGDGVQDGKGSQQSWNDREDDGRAHAEQPDQTERCGRRSRCAGDKTNKQRGGYFMADISQEIGEADTLDTGDRQEDPFCGNDR